MPLKAELLAPAGTKQKAEYAFAYGADAVYLGVPSFSLRMRINSFTEKQVAEIISLAHRQQKKVYVTVNTYPFNKHLRAIEKHLRFLAKVKPDAIIFSDPGVLRLLKKYCPHIDWHLSTQANCLNYEAARFWQEQGVKRIILAREASLADIRSLHRHCPNLELEYFVHGAMCMSLSGRCLLSSYFLGRSANLGDCVQPCRWEYKITSLGKTKEDLIAREEGGKTYLLNANDLCLLEHLTALRRAGITSFKIEGRAKSLYYVSLVTKVYREALSCPARQREQILPDLKKELLSLPHRGYSLGFLYPEKPPRQLTDQASLSGKYEFVGVSEIGKDNQAFGRQGCWVKVHNAIYLGDKVEIFAPSWPLAEKKKVLIKEIFSETGEKLTSAHGGQNKIYFFPLPFSAPPYSLWRKKI